MWHHRTKSRNFVLYTSYLVLLLAAFAVPFAAFAACPVGQQAIGTNADGSDICGPASGDTGAGAADGGGGGGTGLPNPLGSVTDVSQIIGNVIRALFGILGSIALLMFIYGGFMWLTSGGNAEKIKKGQDTMVWAILGIAVIFSSYAIVNFVIERVVTSG